MTDAEARAEERAYSSILIGMVAGIGIGITSAIILFVVGGMVL